MPFETVSALIRHGLTTAGGYLVSMGVISDVDAATGVGAGMALAGIAWSIFRKWTDKPRKTSAG